jgi:hypothetical protein
MKKEDFSKMSNADINLKIMGYDNEYKAKKSKIMGLINDLIELDALYIEANNELKKRGFLDGNG